ncbi:unnamed protein product [Prorocentrum cordatum]|uniref:Rieske domain-containing protein n=1 Tax=Prorocentrum cordatum TaxID=2364126 RepID=A0ABN9T0A9_9DINO|nr:unnamed protein product [Polarella glacialis]
MSGSDPAGGRVSDEGLILDLRGADYSGGPAWINRAPGGHPDAVVPLEIEFDRAERAFLFPAAGELISISVPIATSLLPEATFAIWVKVLEPFSGANFGWVLSQAPDYSWSRALTLNDFRLGHVSMTTSQYWDSQLGRAGAGRWLHLAGVWRKEGRCTPFLNGAAGATCQGRAGRGSDPGERLMVGGRDHGDQFHNAAVAVSDVCVYSRALSEAEVERLFRRGRGGAGGGAHVGAGATPRAAREGAAPMWDEESGLFWFPAGVALHELPDGRVWQHEFRSAMAECQSAPEVAKRSLQRHASDDNGPLPTGARVRQLAQHPSDPEKLERRMAHTKALRRMPGGSGRTVQIHGKEVALFRFGERVHAVQAACPHQGANLADGEIGDLEDMIEGHRCYVTCPVHKFQFDLSTGALLQGRGCGPLPVFAVRVSRRGSGDAGQGMIEVGFESLGASFFEPGEDF